MPVIALFYGIRITMYWNHREPPHFQAQFAPMITNPAYYPEVVQVVAGTGYELFVYFNDGSIHRFDAEPLLAGAVFAPVRDPDVFRDTLTVMNRTVAWDIDHTRAPDRCIDLDPITLYRDTPEVEEPDLSTLGAQVRRAGS